MFFEYSQVGMVKQPTAEQTEFQMSSEDFPALPGTQLNDGSISASSTQQINLSHSLGTNTSSSTSGTISGDPMGGLSGTALDCGSGVTRDLENKVHQLTSIGDLQAESSHSQDKAFKRGIQTSPDGLLNILNLFL